MSGGSEANRLRVHLLALVAVAALGSACALAPAAATPQPAPTPTLPCPVAAGSPPPIASASAPPPAAPQPTEPAPPSPALKAALEAATKATAAADWAGADKHLAAATTAAGDDPHLAYLVARVRATRFVTAGDLESASAAFVAVMPSLAGHPELRDEFWAHNAMMMIREAQGDPAGALAENDQATLSAARGTWDDEEREDLAFQKDRWHRAYLTRMLAESRTGAAKRALIQYAEAALADYRTRGFGESVAVLEAYFASLDGKRDAAVAAARRVDPSKDDDVEDLYLVVVGLEAGGDHAGAEAVRRVMRRPGAPSISRAIMLRWLDADARTTQPRTFTPWHATAR